jgi:hypothetical protein
LGSSPTSRTSPSGLCHCRDPQDLRGSRRRGTIYYQVRSVPSRSEERFKVTAYDPPGTWRYEASSGRSRPACPMPCKPFPREPRVTNSVDLKLRGPGRLLGPVAVFLTPLPRSSNHAVSCEKARYRSRTEAAVAAQITTKTTVTGGSADLGIRPSSLYISVVMLPQRQCKGSEQTVLEAEPKRRYHPPGDPRSMRSRRAIQRGAGPTITRSQQQGNGPRCSHC